MEDVFGTAVRLAEEGIAEMGDELVDDVIRVATDQLDIIPVCLASVPAEHDSPIGEYVEASLRVSNNWTLASKAEKLAVISFLDICSEMIERGEMTPQKVYTMDDFEF